MKLSEKFKRVSDVEDLDAYTGHGDCLELLKEVPDACVDLVFADLPYGVTNRNKWDVIIPMDLLWEQLLRVGHDKTAYIFTATFGFAVSLFNSNPSMFKYDLVWEKPIPTGFLNANRMPMRAHENVLVFYKKLPVYNPQWGEGKPYETKVKKGKVSTNYGVYENIPGKSDGRRYPRSVVKVANPKIDLINPTQKPVELVSHFVQMFSDAGSVVLDPTFGGGTTGVVCAETGRQFIGMELNDEFYERATERIERAWTIRGSNRFGIPVTESGELG